MIDRTRVSSLEETETLCSVSSRTLVRLLRNSSMSRGFGIHIWLRNTQAYQSLPFDKLNFILENETFSFILEKYKTLEFIYRKFPRFIEKMIWLCLSYLGNKR